MLPKINNDAVSGAEIADEKKLFEGEPLAEVRDGFAYAAKVSPSIFAAPTIDAAAYWGEQIRRAIARGNAYDLFLTRVAGIVLQLGEVNKHEEWLPTYERKVYTTDENGKRVPARDENGKIIKETCTHKVPVEAISHCYTAYSDVVSFEVVNDGERVEVSGKRCCNNEKNCPYDAKKASIENTAKTQSIQAHARKQGYKSVMITLTARHNSETKDVEFVAALCDSLRKVFKLLRDKRKYRKLIEKYGITDGKVIHSLPYIRALEETIGGSNGSHYHFHILLFFDGPKAGYTEIADVFKELWLKQAARHGLDPTETAGFRCDIVKPSQTEKAAAYVCKINKWHGAAKDYAKTWSSASEIAGFAFKRARRSGDGFTPFELLAKIAMVDAPSYCNARTDGERKAAYNEFWHDVLIYCKYAAASAFRRCVDFSNGLESWIDSEETHDDKDTVFGVSKAAFGYFVNYGILQSIKKAILDGDDTTAALVGILEEKGFEVKSAAEVEKIRKAEAQKRADRLDSRRRQAKIRHNFAAAVEDLTVSLRDARVVLDDRAYFMFEQRRREYLREVNKPFEQLLLFDELPRKRAAGG